jgi:hypothetical protein
MNAFFVQFVFLERRKLLIKMIVKAPVMKPLTIPIHNPMIIDLAPPMNYFIKQPNEADPNESKCKRSKHP